MLRTLVKGLKPEGALVCQYHLDLNLKFSKMDVFIRRVIAALTFGNREYEPGDSLWFDIEFTHAFSLEDQVKSELEAGGFEVLNFYSGHNQKRVGAICRKKST